jgi:hypothetical protein
MLTYVFILAPELLKRLKFTVRIWGGWFMKILRLAVELEQL